MCIRTQFFSALPLDIRNLHLIKWITPKGEPREFRLIGRVSKEWRKFGRRINLSESEIHGLQGKDQDISWTNVMGKWIEGRGQNEYPLCWESLYRMLTDVQLGGVIFKLKEAVTGAANSPHPLI